MFLRVAIGPKGFRVLVVWCTGRKAAEKRASASTPETREPDEGSAAAV